MTTAAQFAQSVVTDARLDHDIAGLAGPWIERPREVRRMEERQIDCFLQVQSKVRIAQEEVFGPVIVIIRSKDLDSALAIENANPYGNAASVFTENGGTARYVMEHASAGMVGVNVGVPVPREPFSFGGWNESRFGTCDITGKSSIEFWTQSKKITTRW